MFGSWYLWIHPWMGYLAMAGAAVVGGLGIAPVESKPDAPTFEAALAFARRTAWVALGLVACGALLIGAVAYLGNGAAADYGIAAAWRQGPAVIAAWVGMFALRVLVVRFVAPWGSALQRRWRVNQEVDSLEDIRDEQARYTPRTYDPRPHWSPEGGPAGRGVFIGQDESKKPVYVPWPTFRETHGQVIGPTRFGKGVVLGLAIAQSIRARFSTWYFDPKGDSHIPAIMAEQARAMGLPFYVLDLVAGIGSYAPFAGGTPQHRAARIIQAYKLEDTGSEGDYYRRGERELLRRVCDRVGPAHASLDRLLKEFQAVKREKFAGDERRLNQDTSVESGLSEWRTLPAIVGMPEAGLNVGEALRSHAVVYVRCSTTGLARDVARNLITELAETVLADEPAKRGEHVYMVTDEARSMISGPLVSALTTVAGAGMTVWLAYQSMLDMRNMDDKRLDAGSVEGAINVNCQVKILYGTNDIETARWVSETSGTKRVLLAQLEEAQTGSFGGERWGEKRSFREEEAPLISPNTVLALPPRVAITLLPSNPAHLMWPAWVPYSRDPLEDALATQRQVPMPSIEGQGRKQKTVPLPGGLDATAGALPSVQMKDPSA